MRTLIKGYTFTAGTRSIDCSNCNTFDIENIRLIINETQKVVICSSMQKDLIVSIIDGVITYADTLPVLADGDKLTIELDKGENYPSAIGLINEMERGKTQIAESLCTKGVTALGSDTYSQLADKVLEVEDVRVVNPPVDGINEFGNTFMNTIMDSSGIMDIYDSVFTQYCTGEGGYVGCLMNVVQKGNNTSIVLKGADAYYIVEDDTFYNADTTHLWGAYLGFNLRHVCYLYLAGSTANGVTEYTHTTVFQLCKNSTIPKVIVRDTQFIYLHFANPYTVVIDTQVNQAQLSSIQFMYCNAEDYNNTNSLLYNAVSLQFLDVKAMKKWRSNYFYTCANSSKIVNLNLNGLERVSGGYFISSVALTTLNLPALTSFTGGYLLNSSTVRELTLPALESFTTSGDYMGLVCNGTLGFLNIPALKYINFNSWHYCGLVYQSLLIKNVEIPALEKWDTLTTGSDSKAIVYGTPSVERVKIGTVTSYKGSVPLIAYGTSNITDVEVGVDFDVPLRMGTANNLTAYNIVNHILINLKDNTGLAKKILTLGAINLARLKAEEIAIATNKNWTLA